MAINKRLVVHLDDLAIAKVADFAAANGMGFDQALERIIVYGVPLPDWMYAALYDRATVQCASVSTLARRILNAFIEGPVESEGGHAD